MGLCIISNWKPVCLWLTETPSFLFLHGFTLIFFKFFVFGIACFFVTTAQTLIQGGDEGQNPILYHCLCFFWVSWENERQGILGRGNLSFYTNLHKAENSQQQSILLNQIWTAVVVWIRAESCIWMFPISRMSLHPTLTKSNCETLLVSPSWTQQI